MRFHEILAQSLTLREFQFYFLFIFIIVLLYVIITFIIIYCYLYYWVLSWACLGTLVDRPYISVYIYISESVWLSLPPYPPHGHPTIPSPSVSAMWSFTLPWTKRVGNHWSAMEEVRKIWVQSWERFTSFLSTLHWSELGVWSTWFCLRE